jgi:hypothetical protein
MPDARGPEGCCRCALTLLPRSRALLHWRFGDADCRDRQCKRADDHERRRGRGYYRENAPRAEPVYAIRGSTFSVSSMKDWWLSGAHIR